MIKSKKIVPKKASYKTYKQRRSIISYIKNSGMIIFVILVGIGLATCILLLNGLLKYTYGGDASVHSASETSSQFDQSTMQKVNQLNTSSQNVLTTSAASDDNPFSENN